jgi:transposase
MRSPRSAHRGLRVQRIDSLEGWPMRGPYPGELRIRVIDFVEAGGSRREAAEQFQVTASSAIRWVQRFREDGTCDPMPRGGSSSPLEEYSQRILALIGKGAGP